MQKSSSSFCKQQEVNRRKFHLTAHSITKEQEALSTFQIQLFTFFFSYKISSQIWLLTKRVHAAFCIKHNYSENSPVSSTCRISHTKNSFLFHALSIVQQCHLFILSMHIYYKSNPIPNILDLLFLKFIKSLECNIHNYIVNMMTQHLVLSQVFLSAFFLLLVVFYKLEVKNRFNLLSR